MTGTETLLLLIGIAQACWLFAVTLKVFNDSSWTKSNERDIRELDDRVDQHAIESNRHAQVLGKQKESLTNLDKRVGEVETWMGG